MLHAMSAWKAQQPKATAGRLLTIILVLALTACASSRSPTLALAQITPLQFDGRAITVDQVPALAPTPDLLAVDDNMGAFVNTYTGELRSDRQRMHTLHQSIKSKAILGVDYVPDAEGDAADVFYRGTANCLSYAHLFVALAREAGLDANYQLVKVRPRWSMVGERLALRLHVNVTIRLRHGEQFTVDIDPLQPSETTGTSELSDNDAVALYHNNIGMEALGRNEFDTAWAHGVRALQFSPDMSLLWVNLGAIYRLAGQHEDAERSYKYALRINSMDRSAMNNLVVLYDLEGRQEESEYWSDRVARYRISNPYYHAWLGDKAGEVEDWPQALMHYSDALRLKPQDDRLQYSVGVIYYQLGDFDLSMGYISKAIDIAMQQGGRLRAEVSRYQMQLDAVREEQLVGLE